MKFAEFLEQRDFELYNNLLNEGFFDKVKKAAAPWALAGALAAGAMMKGKPSEKQIETPSNKPVATNVKSVPNNVKKGFFKRTTLVDYSKDKDSETWVLLFRGYDNEQEVKKEAVDWAKKEIINRNSDFKISGNNISQVAKNVKIGSVVPELEKNDDGTITVNVTHYINSQIFLNK